MLSGTLDRGKARSRRAGAATVTCGTAAAPNSLYCAFSIGLSSGPSVTVPSTAGKSNTSDGASYTGGVPAAGTTLAKSSAGSRVIQNRPAQRGPRSWDVASPPLCRCTSPAIRTTIVRTDGTAAESVASSGAAAFSIQTTASCADTSVAPCVIRMPPVRCHTSYEPSVHRAACVARMESDSLGSVDGTSMRPASAIAAARPRAGKAARAPAVAVSDVAAATLSAAAAGVDAAGPPPAHSAAHATRSRHGRREPTRAHTNRPGDGGPERGGGMADSKRFRPEATQKRRDYRGEKNHGSSHARPLWRATSPDDFGIYRISRRSSCRGRGSIAATRQPASHAWQTVRQPARAGSFRPWYLGESATPSRHSR